MANPSKEENDLLFHMVRRDDLDFLHYVMSHDENARDCTSHTSGRHLLDYAAEASERMPEAVLRYGSLGGSLAAGKKCTENHNHPCKIAPPPTIDRPAEHTGTCCIEITGTWSRVLRSQTLGKIPKLRPIP
jgi:hypothetical protein